MQIKKNERQFGQFYPRKSLASRRVIVIGVATYFRVEVMGAAGCFAAETAYSDWRRTGVRPWATA